MNPDNAKHSNGQSRRDFLRYAAGGIIASPLLVSMASCADPKKVGAAQSISTKPNIIICLCDDLGWGDVGYNGHPILKTPNIDAMAENGIRFDRFYAPAPICSPSRGAFMTGRHPSRYHCTWLYDLPLREITIAEAVRTVGYRTGLFGKWHLGAVNPADKGLGGGGGVPPSYDAQQRNPGNQGFDEWFSGGFQFDLDPPAGRLFQNGQPVGAMKGDSSDITMDKALDFIRSNAKSHTPFMAFIGFSSPHSPYRALDADKAPYAVQGKAADRYGEVVGIDRAIGKLRKELRELGIHDDTMLWFTSDNGADADGSNGPLSGYKLSLREGGIRVPCLLEWPARVRQPWRTSIPVTGSDIYPTILELLGIKMPQQPEPIDGISLWPIIDRKVDHRPQPIGFQYHPDPSPEMGFRDWNSAAWIDNEYKLLVCRGADKSVQLGRVVPMLPDGTYLYNVDTDPAEETDLAAEHPDIVARMTRGLEQWQASVCKSMKEYQWPDPEGEIEKWRRDRRQSNPASRETSRK